MNIISLALTTMRRVPFLLLIAILTISAQSISATRPYGALSVLSSDVQWFDTSDRVALETLEDQYNQDLQHFVELRSRSLEELITFSSEIERKWRQLDWNYYARIIAHVCSEISNRGGNDWRLRGKAEQFAKTALSHSAMFLWEYQTDLVYALNYQRSSSADVDWLQERRDKTRLWLEVWHRLEQQSDPTFDIRDPRNRPTSRVFPPAETGLPAGTPPSAIKDPKLRVRYETDIAENKKKSKRVEQQVPLLLHGPAFKAHAERTLIQLYSQPPARTAELRHYLMLYLNDRVTREQILKAVQESAK